MPNLPEDDDRPEPAHIRQERELHEAYRRKFGEYPPMFLLGTGPEAIEAIKAALKTGRPIREEIPPGSDA